MSSMPENVDDRLSMLPEDILSQLLSFMPTKFAVRTSILCKRWRYVWTSAITNLDFDYTRRRPYIKDFADGNEEHFTQFVDRVFSFCKTPHVKLFRLHVSNYLVPWSSIENWVDNAVRLNVCELDICLLHCELPLSVFTCNTLTNLRLEIGTYVDFDYWEEFPSRIYLPCLKTLDLAGYPGSLCTAFELISGCPVLESLSLELLYYPEEVCIFNIPTLKRLKLLYRSAADGVINKVVLRVPKLEYLFVGGILGSLFVMEDVSSLVEASIVCWRSTCDYLWADLLNKIRAVQNLSIENFPFTSPLPFFPNLKQLELNRTWKSGQITHFLKSCPELKILCIDFVDWRVFKKSEESSWIEFEPKFIPACMIANLTTIKFSKCEGDESDIAFLEYMLGNSQVLKTVTVFALENLLVSEDPWFCEQVLRIPRASQHCEIHFRSWKLPPSQDYEDHDSDEAFFF